MRLALALAAALLLASPAPAQTADAFLAGYRAEPAATRDAQAEVFLESRRTAGGLPIVDADGISTFLHLADRPEARVAITGDFTVPDPFRAGTWSETGVAMAPVAPGSRLFVYRRRFEPDARVDYQLVVDGKPIVDPYNLHNRDGGIRGPVSELTMPGYPAPPLAAAWTRAPAGRMVTLGEPWAWPRVRVYLPPGYRDDRRYPVVYVPDGAGWADYLHLPQTIDALVAQGRIEPPIAVLMDAPEDRSRFYHLAPDYLAYLDRVVAHVDAHFATRAERRHRAHLGTSAGARAALFAALERPQAFGMVGMLSPAVSAPASFYERLYGPRTPFAPDTRFWVSAGSYEGALFDDAKALERYFAARGLPAAARYTREGHSFAAWRNLLPDVLTHFFAPHE